MTINGRWTDTETISPVKPDTTRLDGKTGDRKTDPFASAFRVSLASARANQTEATLGGDDGGDEPTPVSTGELGWPFESASGSSDDSESAGNSIYSDPYDGRYGDGIVRFVDSRGELCDGYYGMDGDGHWGYYYDAARTQKIPGSGWEEIKASDGGRALFDLKNGFLWPAMVRDESRAGQTVTLAAGSRAFEVEYDDYGYVRSVVNLSQTQGINGHDLDLPVARSLDDRGVGGSELKRLIAAQNDSGKNVKRTDGATYKDWEPVMLARTADSYAQTGESYGSAEGYGATAQIGEAAFVQLGSAASVRIGEAASTQSGGSAAAGKDAAGKTARPLVEMANAERAAFEARPTQTAALHRLKDVRIARDPYFDTAFLDEDEDKNRNK